MSQYPYATNTQKSIKNFLQRFFCLPPVNLAASLLILVDYTSIVGSTQRINVYKCQD